MIDLAGWLELWVSYKLITNCFETIVVSFLFISLYFDVTDVCSWNCVAPHNFPEFCLFFFSGAIAFISASS